MPSADVTVVSGSNLVNPCNTWATHSHPVLVDKACWCGAVACWTISAICCAMVLATRHLMTSLAMIPLTPPSRFVSPNGPCQPQSEGLWLVPDGNTTENNSKFFLPCNSGRRWSDVIPDGPPAAPLLEDRKLRQSLSVSNDTGT